MERETLSELYDSNRAGLHHVGFVCFILEAMICGYQETEIFDFLRGFGYTPEYMTECKRTAERYLREIESKQAGGDAPNQ